MAENTNERNNNNTGRNESISELLERLQRSINEISERVRSRVNLLNEQLNSFISALEQSGFSFEDKNVVINNLRRFQQHLGNSISNLINDLENLSDNISSRSVSRRDVENIRSRLDSINNNIEKILHNNIERIRNEIEAGIRSIGERAGISTFNVNEIIQSIESGKVNLTGQLKSEFENLRNIYNQLGSLRSIGESLTRADDIISFRRDLSNLQNLIRTGELERYFRNLQASQLEFTTNIQFPEFTISNLSRTIENLLSGNTPLANTINNLINRGIQGIDDVIEGVGNRIQNLIDLQSNLANLTYAQRGTDADYIRQLTPDVLNVEHLLGDRFIRRELSERISENIRSLADLSRREINNFMQTFGRFRDIFSPVLDLQPHDVATGGGMGIDFANGVRRISTLFGDMGVMLSQHLANTIDNIERSMHQAVNREPFLYTEKFIEQASQRLEDLRRRIPHQIRLLAETYGVDISRFDLSTPEGILGAYQELREHALRRIQVAGEDFRKYLPVVELGNMIQAQFTLERDIQTATRQYQLTMFPELATPMERFRYSFIEPLREGLSELGSFTLGSLHWLAMFGLSNAFFLSATMLPMEQTFRTYIPIYQAIGGLFGFTQLIDRFQDFVSILPYNMENLAQQYILMTGLTGSRYLAQNMIRTALDISRVEPIQFEEAMQVLTALGVNPQLRSALGSREFQRDVLDRKSVV